MQDEAAAAHRGKGVSWRPIFVHVLWHGEGRRVRGGGKAEARPRFKGNSLSHLSVLRVINHHAVLDDLPYKITKSKVHGGARHSR